MDATNRFAVPRASSGRLLLLPVAPDSAEPLYRQVYDALRTRIVDGALRKGSPLPSTRALSRELNVSRSTVVLAYEQLRVEGYVETRRGAVCRVCGRLPDRSVRPSTIAGVSAPAPHAGVPSARASAVLRVPRPLPVVGRPPSAFRVAVPAVDMFPVDTWGRLLARRWQRTPARALTYGDPFGYLPLREAIAEYVAAARGVRCVASQVMIVTGTQEAIDLTCRVALDPGDSAWLEDPGYYGALGALTAAGARVVNVPVDAEGICVREGIRLAPSAKLAYVTPARQMPLEVTMSATRRQELVNWARRANAWILEDDYDSEFRYSGQPLAALHALDPDGSVIHTGTFSKLLLPALRIGYVVVPPRLIDAFGAVRQFMDHASPYLEQAVLADFIVEGHFERHVRRIRAVYHERQQLLVECVHHELAGRISLPASDSGRTLIGWLPKGMRDTSVAHAARRHDVDLLPLSAMTERVMPPAMVFGYAGVNDREIREGVTRLARAFDSLDRLRC